MEAIAEASMIKKYIGANFSNYSISMINFIAVKKFLMIGIVTVSMSNIACIQVSPVQIHQRIACSPQSKNVFLMTMDMMMRKMDTVKTGISPDHDFMSQMIPHHEGAIEMARYEMENGTNFQIVQLAKGILTEQAVEIQQMEGYRKLFLPVDYPLKDTFKKEMNETMGLMMHNMPADREHYDVDTAFVMVMIPHHQAGIDMAKVILKFSSDKKTIGLSKQIIASQEVEIGQMCSFLNKGHE
jgi:uncharacterized protein (DUF305 family)